MFYAIYMYMATRPRACACIFKTLGLMLYLFIWDLGAWPLYRGGLYSGVAVKRVPL